MSLGITEKLGMSREDRIRVFNMVALHTQIYKLSVEQLSTIGNRTLIGDLIQLGRADHEGRFHEKGDAVIPELSDIPIKPLDATVVHPKGKEVVILCGLPGSGKSFWVNQQLITRDSKTIISRDRIITERYPDLNYNEAWEVSDQKYIDRELQR